MASRSCRVSASKYAVITACGVAPRALEAMPGRYRPAPCASRPDRGRWAAASACSPASGGCACRCPGPACPTATRGRSRPGDGIVLIDTGTHEPGSLGQLERALDQVGLRLEHVRLLVCTHAHADHCGQAGPILERAGCELWVNPNLEHFNAQADDPEAAHARRVEIARQSGVPVEPPDRGRPLAAGPLHPDRDLVPGRGGRDRPRHLVGPRHARPRALPRLPVPARAPAADLRRPPAGPRLALLRLRLQPRPGGRVPRARSTSPTPSAPGSR